MTLAAGLTMVGCAGRLEITALRVVTVTGSEASDATIELCYQRLDTRAEECVDLSSEANDFEAGARDEFLAVIEDPINVDVAGGLPAMSRMAFVNRGGGILHEPDWTLTALEVRAELDDSSLSGICVASGLSVTIDYGQRFDPEACP